MSERKHQHIVRMLISWNESTEYTFRYVTMKENEK